jgi:hypothetical protein
MIVSFSQKKNPAGLGVKRQVRGPVEEGEGEKRRTERLFHVQGIGRILSRADIVGASEPDEAISGWLRGGRLVVWKEGLFQDRRFLQGLLQGIRRSQAQGEREEGELWNGSSGTVRTITKSTAKPTPMQHSRMGCVLCCHLLGEGHVDFFRVHPPVINLARCLFFSIWLMSSASLHCRGSGSHKEGNAPEKSKSKNHFSLRVEGMRAR